MRTAWSRKRCARGCLLRERIALKPASGVEPLIYFACWVTIGEKP